MVLSTLIATMLKPILLVEDNPNDLELTLLALERSQLAIDVVVTRDGAEALDYLHARNLYAQRVPGNPGVVLLDSPIVAGWKASALQLAKKTQWIAAMNPGKKSKTRRQHWPNIEAVVTHFQHKRAFAHWHPQALQDYAQHGTQELHGERVLSFDRDVETAIYNSLPHNLPAMLQRHPLKCPLAFIGGTHSREMQLGGTELTDKISKGRVMWLDGSHLFPMEKPMATAAARAGSDSASRRSRPMSSEARRDSSEPRRM